MRTITFHCQSFRMKFKILASTFALGCTTAAAQGKETKVPYFDKTTFSPIFDLVGLPNISLVTFNQFKATSQNAKIFTEGQLKGKYTVLNFFFASCGGICPLLMGRINTFKEKLDLKNRVQFVSISVTPDIDTPSLLSHFAETQKLNQQNWLLLSGDKKRTEKLALDTFRSGVLSKNQGVVNDKIPDFVHSESLFLLDKDLKLRGIYNGKNTVEYGLLAEDLAILIAGEK